MTVSLLHSQIKLSQVRTTVLPNNLDSVMRLGGIKAIYHLVTPAFRVRVTALAAVYCCAAGVCADCVEADACRVKEYTPIKKPLGWCVCSLI